MLAFAAFLICAVVGCRAPQETRTTELFKRLDAPKPGEWRYEFHEEPQSLVEYQTAVTVRPTASRRTIVLQPLGDMDAGKQQVLETMRAYVSVFFRLPARIEPPLPLTAAGEPLWRAAAGARQYDGDRIMAEILGPHIPDDAIAYLGITMADLYSGDLNYVFGVATLEKRVGVYSLCRYYPEFWGESSKGAESELLGLRRACKVINHETGHMFGLTHCLDYQCSMNGTNSLAETDAAPMHYCPVCEKKLAWNLGFDSARWYDGLEGFYREKGFAEEADWMSRRKSYVVPAGQ